MPIVEFKDFTIENITDTVREVSEFQGTFADNRTNICEILIDISTLVGGKDVDLKMTIKPQELGAYQSYEDDRDKGFGIATEIFKDLISHAIEGGNSLTLNEFVRHYFEKFGCTHSVELSFRKHKYLGHTVLYLPTEDSKSTDVVSLNQVIFEDVDLTNPSIQVVQFTLDDLTIDLIEKLVDGLKLAKSQQRDYDVALDHLQYAKEVAEKRNSFVYYKSALELILNVKSKHHWGILPLELVCKDNLVRGELKRLFPTAIKKMANDNIVYSLQALLSEVKINDRTKNKSLGPRALSHGSRPLFNQAL